MKSCMREERRRQLANVMHNIPWSCAQERQTFWYSSLVDRSLDHQWSHRQEPVHRSTAYCCWSSQRGKPAALRTAGSTMEQHLSAPAALWCAQGCWRACSPSLRASVEGWAPPSQKWLNWVAAAKSWVGSMPVIGSADASPTVVSGMLLQTALLSAQARHCLDFHSCFAIGR